MSYLQSTLLTIVVVLLGWVALSVRIGYLAARDMHADGASLSVMCGIDRPWYLDPVPYPVLNWATVIGWRTYIRLAILRRYFRDK